MNWYVVVFCSADWTKVYEGYVKLMASSERMAMDEAIKRWVAQGRDYDDESLYDTHGPRVETIIEI